MYKRIGYILVPTIISLIIFFLCCLIPVDDVPDLDFYFPIQKDKVVHFLMYFGLSGATAVNYIWGKRGNVNVVLLIIGAFALPILYGGVIEILQYKYFPPRSGDWWDFLADVLGSLAAVPFVIWFRNYLLNRKKHNYR